MFSAWTSDTWSSVNPADRDVIFSSGFFLAWHDMIIWYAHEHVFHYADYDIIIRGRGWKCSYFLITHGECFRVLLKPPVQIISSDRWPLHTAPSPLEGNAALSDTNGVVSSRLPGFIQLGNLPVRATATKHAGQVWLCALAEIDITPWSISNQAASERWTLSLSSQRLQPAAASLALHRGVTAVLKSSLTV